MSWNDIGYYLNDSRRIFCLLKICYSYKNIRNALTIYVYVVYGLYQMYKYIKAYSTVLL